MGSTSTPGKTPQGFGERIARSAWRRWQDPQPIDADLLERLARIARGLPGHVVSVDAEDRGELELWPRRPPGDADLVVRIDGVVARDILEHYQHLLELG